MEQTLRQQRLSGLRTRAVEKHRILPLLPRAPSTARPPAIHRVSSVYYQQSFTAAHVAYRPANLRAHNPPLFAAAPRPVSRAAVPVPNQHPTCCCLLQRQGWATAQSGRFFNIQIQASWGNGQNSSSGSGAGRERRASYTRYPPN